MFQDRIEAGQQLAAKLKKHQYERGVILAVPRGGVPVAYMVARELGFPLDLIFTKKIGHPMQKEFAIGAASLTDYFITPQSDVTMEYIQKEAKSIRTKLKEMYQKFMGDKEPEKIKGKTVIVVDDGMATGNTILGTIKILRQGNPGKIIVAVPVASENAVSRLAGEADEVITLSIPPTFYGVGAFYKNFNQVSDDEVMFYLDKLRRIRKAS